MSVKYTIYLPRFIADDKGKPTTLNPDGSSKVYAMLLDVPGVHGFTKHDFATGNWKSSDGEVIEEFVEVIEIIVTKDEKETHVGLWDVCLFIKEEFNQNTVLFTKQYGLETTWI